MFGSSTRQTPTQHLPLTPVLVLLPAAGPTRCADVAAGAAALPAVTAARRGTAGTAGSRQPGAVAGHVTAYPRQTEAVHALCDFAHSLLGRLRLVARVS